MQEKTKHIGDTLRAYAIAVAIVLTTLGIRLGLVPWLGYKAPFLLFFVAVMAAAQFCGRGPGIAATILSLLTTWYFLMPKINSFAMESTIDAFNLLIFFAAGCGITLLCDRLRNAVTIAARRERTTEALLESAAQGIIGVKADGRIAIVNSMTERLFGYTRAELLGEPMEILIPEGKRDVHRTHRTSFQSNPNPRPMGLGLELAGRRKDGSEFRAEVSLSWVETEEGRLSVAFITDITARRRAEESLRDQAEMLDLAQDPIFTWNSEGVIRHWNHGAEALYGFTAQEAIGRVVRDLLQTKLAVPGDGFEPDLVQGGAWIGEIEYTTKAGNRVVVESRMVVYQRALGDRLILETNRDITERKRVAEEIAILNASLERRVHDRTSQLEAANKELEAFAYSVSHDLRAPLRGIDGWSMAFLEDYGAQCDERGKSYLNRVRSETQRLGQLIDDLLEFSRVTRLQIAHRPVNLTALANKITGRLLDFETTREIQFVIEPDLRAEGDESLLAVVLTNLFENAVKFTKGRSPAIIEFGQVNSESGPEFFVRDNGVGFDMRYAHNLFGVFQRLHKASEFAGTGIGLATVARIINRHGGSIRAESKIGEGAVFYFRVSS